MCVSVCVGIFTRHYSPVFANIQREMTESSAAANDSPIVFSPVHTLLCTHTSIMYYTRTVNWTGRHLAARRGLLFSSFILFSYSYSAPSSHDKNIRRTDDIRSRDRTHYNAYVYNIVYTHTLYYIIIIVRK